MKKTVKAMALRGLLTLVALSWRVEGSNDHTYVANQSSKWTIVATTSYNFPGHSSFINRLIAPDTYQADQYNEADCASCSDCNYHVKVELWVSGSSAHNTAVVDCDHSVVGFDNHAKTGVDIYKSVYGQIYTPSGSVLFTIYP